MDELPVAGFWRRYVAYAIDSIVFAIPSAVVLAPYDAWIDAQTKAWLAAAPTPAAAEALAARLQLLDMATGVVLAQLVMAVPAALFLASRWRATPGKQLVGLCVVDGAGQRLGLKRALARELWKVPALGALGLGVLAVAWRADRRGWHDRLTGSFAVRRWPLEGWLARR